MNLQSIIIANCIGFLILLVLLVSSYMVRQRKLLSDRAFYMMCIITACSCIADMLAFILEGFTFKGARQLAILLDSVTYINNIFVSFLWTMYVDLRLYKSKDHMKKTAVLICPPAIVGIAGIFVNLKEPLVFSLDEKNVYHRGYFALAYLAVLQHSQKQAQSISA